MFQGIITGGKSAGEAIKELGASLINMFLKWKVQQLLAQAFSKSTMAASLAASSVTAAATAAAWAPAAAMVNAATFGAASAAGMTSLTGMSALSSIMPSFLADGGVVTAPTLAVLGEGSESEAVLPLSKLSGLMNSSGGGSVQVNVINQTQENVRASASARMNGKKTVIDLFIQGYNDNVSGIQDIVRSR
jgi:hypothetical protein